jgi:hypothetical protein
MTPEQTLDKLEAEFKRYFYYRHIKKDFKTGEECNLHAFVTIDDDHVVGGSLKDGFTEKDVDALVFDFRASLIHGKYRP